MKLQRGADSKSLRFNNSEFSSLVKYRRSIPPEQFDSSRKVGDSIITEMLENANWAPTHGLTEPWRFVVFAGEGLQRLGIFQSDLYKKITLPNEFKKKKYEKLLQRPLLASHIIAIGMKRQEVEKIPEIEEIEATACAVQNLCLTAASYNISAYWTTGGITYEDSAKDFFGLQLKDKLLGFLYIGYPQKWIEGKRQPVKDKVKWVR